MIPLTPALALAIFSFICSALVILRIVIPILPPHPLSRRVPPAEFGLPQFRSLSSADKIHIWLASLDLLALSIFVWQLVSEAVGGPSDSATANDPASAVRLWFAMTIRQTCLLVVAFITLLHVRMGRSVSFGAMHWMLWSPILLLAVTSTTLAAVLSSVHIRTLFIGLVAYSSTVAFLSTIAFVCLVSTLVIIKRNLAALNEETEPWPPAQVLEEKLRPSFATEDIDALRDGASWITSTASSRRNSISAWSFSTHHTAVSSHHGHGYGNPSLPPKSSFWFGSSIPHDDSIPPVPPLPSPYAPTPETLDDPDPFRRDAPALPGHPRPRLESQTSWLTSTNGSHSMVSAWSYPTSQHEGSIRDVSTPDPHTPLTAASRPLTPLLADARVLGGYGFAPGSVQAENGLAALAAPAGTPLDISMLRLIGWLLIIWVPTAVSYPYLITASQHTSATSVISILLVLSITISSPLLLASILLKSPIPIPSGLFDVRAESPPEGPRGPSPIDSDAPFKWSSDYKRSMSTSVTVVEGRRSGDVWLANGDAVDGKSKISRAMGVLAPMPKLSLLPTKADFDDVELSPPLPIQDEYSLPISIYSTPHSETSVQFGRIRKDSKASSHLSGGDDGLAFASRIMIAQRHYSALAQTVVVCGSSDNDGAANDDVVLGSTTGAIAISAARESAHLRSRSASSITGPHTPNTRSTFNISPPPSFPLPPTPPSVRAARLASLAHKKSFSSSFSFGPVDDMNEIDALTAGVLPLLVPGINMNGMKVKEGHRTPPSSFSKTRGKKVVKKLREFGEDVSSPEIHSTPARTRAKTARDRKTSTHKRNHYSLPSLGLGKDGIHSLTSWGTDICIALEKKVGQYTATPSNVNLGRRYTVFGGEVIPNNIPNLQVVEEEDHTVAGVAGLGCSMSARSLGLGAEVPHDVNSVAQLPFNWINIPPSAASTVTLFEEFAAELENEVQAQSTPLNTVSSKPKSTQAALAMSKPTRRSSIVYIKSDDQAPPTNPVGPSTIITPPSTISTLGHWSSRAVRPLIPKASKLQRKMSNASSVGGNLRPLSLLQKRDFNTANSVAAEIRPLTFGKRQKSRVAAPVQDENEHPDSVKFQNKNLKQLKLARSETSKIRGQLRKNEVLPDVIVRPPSDTAHNGFAYFFQDQVQ